MSLSLCLPSNLLPAERAAGSTREGGPALGLPGGREGQGKETVPRQAAAHAAGRAGAGGGCLNG